MANISGVKHLQNLCQYIIEFDIEKQYFFLLSFIFVSRLLTLVMSESFPVMLPTRYCLQEMCADQYCDVRI